MASEEPWFAGNAQRLTDGFAGLLAELRGGARPKRSRRFQIRRDYGRRLKNWHRNGAETPAGWIGAAIVTQLREWLEVVAFWFSLASLSGLADPRRNDGRDPGRASPNPAAL